MLADTSTVAPGSTMYGAEAGTRTDQAPPAPEVAVSWKEPMATVTLAPDSRPVLPVIANPAAFSSALIVSSSAMVLTDGPRVLGGCTVTVACAVVPS